MNIVRKGARKNTFPVHIFWQCCVIHSGNLRFRLPFAAGQCGTPELQIITVRKTFI
jgi:hypothetical protein